MVLKTKLQLDNAAFCIALRKMHQHLDGGALY